MCVFIYKVLFSIYVKMFYKHIDLRRWQNRACIIFIFYKNKTKQKTRQFKYSKQKNK